MSPRAYENSLALAKKWQQDNHEHCLEQRRKRIKVNQYVYAVYADPVAKIGISTSRDQLFLTRYAAKKIGFDFADAEIVWTQEGGDDLERFIQAYAGCVWQSARRGATRASEWFLVPGFDAESIALKLKEWHAIYEGLVA